MTVAALYIDPRGPYPTLGLEQGAREMRCKWCRHTDDLCTCVDCWDLERDARKYEGPAPIVAHPPCRHWCGLKHLAHVGCSACDWRGLREHFNGHCDGRVQCEGGSETSDRDCAPRAVEQVRRWGGVLEHPAGSLLWSLGSVAPSLPAVAACGERCSAFGCTLHTDAFGGFTIEVDQVKWGHVARKRTWLYIVGVSRERVAELVAQRPFPGREPTHYASGGRTKSSRNGGAVPPGIKVCSAQQRRRTPPAFAEFLVSIARSVSTPTGGGK